jgi:putative SOS response-associated peptidase YedK
MCGRYVRKSDKQRITEAFKLGKLPPDFVLPPDYNVAPQTFQPVITLNKESGERELSLMRWGLVPFSPTVRIRVGLSHVFAAFSELLEVPRAFSRKTAP